VIHDVEGVDAGLYHYDVQHHQLEQLRTGDLRVEIARAALDQRMAALANVVFVWTAVFPRSMWKYRQRAYRYVYLDAGHIAQNLALAAVALGLGSCQIAALYDEEANELLGVDGVEESTIYMTVVGRPN
jgi:SagB-type dehydrogenase family enzyme